MKRCAEENKEAGRGSSDERTHQIESGEQAGETERDEDQPELERLVKVHALPLSTPGPMCSIHSVSMSMPGGPGGRAIFPSSFSLVELGKESRILPRIDDQVALGRSPMQHSRIESGRRGSDRFGPIVKTMIGFLEDGHGERVGADLPIMPLPMIETGSDFKGGRTGLTWSLAARGTGRRTGLILIRVDSGRGRRMQFPQTRLDGDRRPARGRREGDHTRRIGVVDDETVVHLRSGRADSV